MKCQWRRKESKEPDQKKDVPKVLNSDLLFEAWAPFVDPNFCLTRDICDIVLQCLVPPLKPLPIIRVIPEICEKLWTERKVVAVATSTGSGKSSRVPAAVLRSAPFAIAKEIVIWVAVPTRVAASTLWKRVQHENPTLKIGAAYDRQIHYDEKTQIRYVTTNHLWNHLIRHHSDGKGLERQVIVLDEIHHSSSETTKLLQTVKYLYGLVPFALLILSATLANIDISFFNKWLHVVSLDQFVFPIQILYCPVDHISPSEKLLIQYGQTQILNCVHVLFRHPEKFVDPCILVFLSGESQIYHLEYFLEKQGKGLVDIRYGFSRAAELAASSDATSEEAKKADCLSPPQPGKIKIVLATDMMESSVTIPGVTHIFDFCICKVPFQKPGEIGITLQQIRCSQSSLQQRAGRTGRTCPGTVYRFISETEFKALPQINESEFTRLTPSIPVLELMRIGSHLNPQVIFQLPNEVYTQVLAHLSRLQLVDISEEKGHPKITELGRKLNLTNSSSLEQALLFEHVHSIAHGHDRPVSLVLEGKNTKQTFIVGDTSKWDRADRDTATIAAIILLAFYEFRNDGILFYKAKTFQERKEYYSEHFADLEADSDGAAYIGLFVRMIRESSYKPTDNTFAKWCWENSINSQTMRQIRRLVKRLCLQIYPDTPFPEWDHFVRYLAHFDANHPKKWLQPVLANWVQILGTQTCIYSQFKPKDDRYTPLSCHSIDDPQKKDLYKLDNRRSLLVWRENNLPQFLLSFARINFVDGSGRMIRLIHFTFPLSCVF
jgi:HrpA-like RNA helicase